MHPTNPGGAAGQSHGDVGVYSGGCYERALLIAEEGTVVQSNNNAPPPDDEIIHL